MSPSTSAALRRILAVATTAVVGCALGIAGFGVYFSKAASYLGTDPATCANCHVMTDYYDAWGKGPHAAVATCDDCHLPADGVIDQWRVKLSDGVLHTTKFTLQTYPQNIRIRESSRAVVDSSCVWCHTDFTNDIRLVAATTGDEVSCVRCHAGVGHR